MNPITIAKAISNLPQVDGHYVPFESIVGHLATVLEAQDPNFQRHEFVAACYRGRVEGCTGTTNAGAA